MGSMTKLENKPNGKCRKWRLFASAGSGGDRVQKSMRFEGTYTEAKERLARFESDFAEERRCAYSTKTLEEYGRAWIDRKEPEITPGTLRSYRSRFASVCVTLGSKPISEITPADIEATCEAMMDGQTKSGRVAAPRYVHQSFVLVKTMLRDAVKAGAIARNPIEDARVPNAPLREREPPRTRSVASLLSSLEPTDARQMALYLCASMGLRRGEACGLSWEDVDGDVLRVRHSLHPDGTLGDTKTGAGRRDLPIPPHVLEALRRRRIAVEADYAKLAEAGIKAVPDTATWPHVAVCAMPDGERVSLGAVNGWWQRHREALGFECSIHDLRHAYLTALAEEGVHPRVMQALAGHSSPLVTLKIYAHANLDQKRDAVEKVASVLHPL